jgi:hypothetical protein
MNLRKSEICLGRRGRASNRPAPAKASNTDNKPAAHFEQGSLKPGERRPGAGFQLLILPVSWSFPPFKNRDLA